MADELTISREGARITVAGEIRTPADCELLKATIDEAIAELGAKRPELIVDVTGARYLDTRRSRRS